MYLPEHFEEKDDQEIARLIAKYPLAIVICNAGDEIIANHIPLMPSGENTLLGHVAKSNQIHHLIENGSKTLAVFSGEDAYVSPNWYPTKPQTHRHVPTWNYQAIHVHGRMTFLHSKKEKTAVVGQLTKLHEQRYFDKGAWKISDAPTDYMDKMIENIVAFKISIEKISAKSKVSQNKAAIDFNNVAKIMENIGKNELYERMRRYSEIEY